MEGGDMYKFSNSLRRMTSSSSAWRKTGMDAFSASSRDRDDEEALKWAALERLPTYDRLRKGILAASRGSGGGFNEIEIHLLGVNERRALMERLVKVAEEDNESFLLKLRDRMDRKWGRG